MRRPKGVKCHNCAPKAWRHTPNLTGDYDLDATIMHRPNRDMAARLNQHLAKPRGAYGTRSAYNGYAGDHGDE